ncbi:MAG: cache domain-containing protein [Candidatus Taylorbacteria bacterium]|nr:cache domain-containing protein [Candidatus Taylorbacteria bacterium]
MKFSIRKKLILIMTLVCVLFALALGFITYFYLSNMLIKEKVSASGKLSTEQVHETTQIIKNDQLFTKMLGTHSRVKEFLQDESEVRRVELLGIFSDYAKEDKKYLAIYLLNKDGLCLISTDSRFVGQDYSFRDYVKKAKKKEASVDVFIGKTSKQFGYYFSEPVLNTQNEVDGIMVVKIDGREIDNPIISSELSKGSTTMMVVDENGVIISSNINERFLKSLGNLSFDEKKKIAETNKFLGMDILPIQYDDIQNIIRNYTSPVTMTILDKIDDENEILNVVKIGEFPFYLITEIGLDDVSSSVFNSIALLSLIIILGLILMSGIIYKSVLTILKPLSRLNLLSQKISDGDFSQRIELNSNDEFSELTGSFNKMANKLGYLYENMDEKVKKRTEELEKSKEHLKKTLEESERANKLMVSRELEMVKLKKEIIDLKNKK